MEDQKQKLIQQQEKDMQALKDKATQDAEKNISEIERNIQAQNQRLEDEALLQEYELDYLQDKTGEFTSKNKELGTNLQNFVMQNQSVSIKQFEQNKKIKMLKTKIDLLESNLSQIVQDFEKERELIKFQNE